MNWFSKGYFAKEISKTLLLGITTAKLVLLENTTDKNTRSGFHPLPGLLAGGFM